MRGIVAAVTSCIGGKEEKFAVQVQPLHAHRYFAYKSMRDFDALWSAMEEIVADIKQRRLAEKEPSMFAKWMESFVDHYAFRGIVQQLREQEKSVISTLNVFLQVVLRRVSGLYVENTILRCGCCDVARKLAFLVRNFLEFSPSSVEQSRSVVDASLSPQMRKRQLSEVRPECSDMDMETTKKAPLFPTRGAGDRSPKARKLSSMGEFCIPTIRKVGLDAPSALGGGGGAPVLPTRRRVFAEVEF
jgi:RNase P/RNase MRP subunit POP5